MDFRIWIGTILIVTVLKFFNIGKSKPVPDLSIAGSWLIKTGDVSGLEGKDIDDSSWQKINVPAAWENAGLPAYDGVAWYRFRFTVPKSWSGLAPGLMLDLGKIDDEDITYINGRSVGGKKGWDQYRKYFIPNSLINYGGENVIAIWVNDTGGGGGLLEGAMKIYPGQSQTFNFEDY